MPTPENPAQAAADEGLRQLLGEHAALRAMLRSVLAMAGRGPRDEPKRFFDIMRAMLFYVDEFPVRIHHRREALAIFPHILREEPALAPVLERLDAEHAAGEARVRQLQHSLTAWEILGDSWREPFAGAARDYSAFYLEHMRLEEEQVFPAARRVLTPAQWKEASARHDGSGDALACGTAGSPAFERLFTRIVTNAPAPIGLGPA